MSKYLTSLLLSSNQGLKCPFCFLLDSGAEFNVIKVGTLNSRVKCDQSEIVSFSGISAGRVSSFGKCVLKLRGIKTSFKFEQTFFVVGNDFNLEVDGILGQEFFRKFSVELNFDKEYIVLNRDNEKTVLPIFTFAEALQIREKYVNPERFLSPNKVITGDQLSNEFEFDSCEPFVLAPRTINVIALCSLSTVECVCMGCELVPGVFVLNVVTSNFMGYTRFIIVNTVNQVVKISRIKVKMAPISEFLVSHGNTFHNNNRISTLNSLLVKTHLNSEEKARVNSIIYKYPESFFLPLDVDFQDIPSIGEDKQRMHTDEDVLSKVIRVLTPKSPSNSKSGWCYAIDLRETEFEMFESTPLFH